jgi:hypothetical protein
MESLGKIISPEIELIPKVAPTYIEGKVWYDSDTKTVSYYDNISGTSIQVGKETVVDARNNTGVTITNGSVVYISGAVGQNPTIALAQADAIATSEVIGLATHNILNNTTGKITVQGLVNDLDTSAFTDGDAVFVDASTAGLLINTAPASPNFVTQVGYVTYAHVSSGQILVAPQRALTNNNQLGTAEIASPTENAVKTYVDNQRDPRTETVASTATLTVDTSLIEQSIITGQAGALTIANPTGSPVNGRKLIIRIHDDGTARAITFNAVFRIMGTTLPTTTVSNKLLYIGCIYNSTDTKWDVVAINNEA